MIIQSSLWLDSILLETGIYHTVCSATVTAELSYPVHQQYIVYVINQAELHKHPVQCCVSVPHLCQCLLTTHDACVRHHVQLCTVHVCVGKSMGTAEEDVCIYESL